MMNVEQPVTSFRARPASPAGKLENSGASDAGCSVFRVFRSEAGEYKTSPELSQVLNPGAWVNLHLHVAEGTGDRPLRLDVANRPAVVEIASVLLRRLDGQTMWSWNPKDLTDVLRIEGSAARMPATDLLRVFCASGSAQVFLPEFRGVAFDQPLDLEIRLRIDLLMAAVLGMIEKFASAADPAQGQREYESRLQEISSDAETRLEAMRAGFDHQMMQHALELEEERRQHQAIMLERGQLVAEQARMLQEVSIAHGNVEELKAELEQLNVAHQELEGDSVELRKDNARLVAILDQERGLRGEMQYSVSWRLTKPLRAVAGLFGRRRKY